MKSAWAIIVLSILATLTAMAEPVAELRSKLSVPDEIWVGQKVMLGIDLVAPGYFASAPVFDLPQVPGVLIFPPIGSPVLGTETVDGIACTVQSHQLMVFSQKPGEIAIPPFEVRFSTKASTMAKDSIARDLKTQALSFTAKSPPGFKPGEPVITSADLTLKESWKPAPMNGKPGDAFVRTLTWGASDAPGMAFPPFVPDVINGLGIYQGDPSVIDHSERGSFHGQRVDRVTYVCKTGGTFTIPARTIRWWDPKTKELKSQELEAHSFRIIAPPPPPVPMSDRIVGFYRLHRNSIFMILAGGMLAAVVFLMTRPFWIRLYRSFFPRHLRPLNPP